MVNLLILLRSKDVPLIAKVGAYIQCNIMLAILCKEFPVNEACLSKLFNITVVPDKQKILFCKN